MQKPDDVNAAQWQAITHPKNHLLIVAGPGTGKTHTLTYRMAFLAQELESHQKILAVTFTHKAADNMASRVAKRWPQFREQIVMGTFHQWCLQVLQQYGKHSGLAEDFKVAGQEDRVALAKTLWPRLKPKERKERLEQISQWKSTEFDGAAPEVLKEYDQRLRELRWLDFDDLLLETYRLFLKNRKTLDDIKGCYRFICVDEYQDINRIQHELLKCVVGHDNHLTAIGDPNQAIYGFRGSEVKYFSSFSQDFVPAEVMSLTENYRNAQNLLSASSQMIGSSGHAQVAKITAQIYQQGRLTIHSCPTEKAEAEYVVHEVEKMVGGTSLFSYDSSRVAADQMADRSFGDVAVLYRLNSQRHALKQAFERSGIPYQVNEPKSEDDDEVCPTREIDVVFDHERVSLMTLHAAKGLEFPVVFIVGCEEKLLPLDLAGLSSNKEEERRLLYVGMTRAKEQLYLLHAKQRQLFGQTHQSRPTPFLRDIEEDLKSYEKISVRRKKVKTEDQMQLF